MELPDGMPNFEDIEKQLGDSEQEKQYYRQQNLGLQGAIESGFLPKSDPNIIEYKLSSEEYLDRLQHYLRGDVIKMVKNPETGEEESIWTLPTKKITVLAIKEVDTDFYYLINEFSGPKEDEWVVISVVNSKGQEEYIQEAYGKILAEHLKKRLGRGKVIKDGYTTREIVDETRTNLSEWGVQEVMGILSTYVNKETSLSIHKEDRINEIMQDFATHLNRFIYLNFDKIGLNTPNKKTKYPLLVIAMMHAVERTYRRSINGIENRGTREGIVITQNERRGDMPFPGMIANKKRWSPFDKSSW